MMVWRIQMAKATSVIALWAGSVMLAATGTAQASPPEAAAWVGSWRASPQALWSGDFVLPTNAPFQFTDQTVRQPMRVSLGGDRWRILLSNAHGTRPLRIGAASFGRSAGSAALMGGTLRPVLFGGAPSVEIPAGGEVLSDPVALAVPALSRVAVSLHLPGPTAAATFHWDARDTGHVVAGNRVEQAELTGATPLSVRVFVAGLLVQADRSASSIVTLGDSITDGNASTVGADRRWPDALAERLAPHGVGVLNAGISGARLLKDGMGANASARLATEVLAQPNVRAVIVLLGTNDIGWPGSPLAPADAPATAAQLIAAYQQLIARGRTHGVRVVGATLLPFEGAMEGTPVEGYFSPAKEVVRQAVNAWIRDSGAFDAVVDFDAAMRDPARPGRLLPRYDSGDHLHPGDEGYRAMAEAVKLDVLGIEPARPVRAR
jgi:lysophospholipase L1-like esterase